MSQSLDVSNEIEAVLRGRRVLIVEDDVGLAGRIARLFKEHAGTDPAECRSIKGALDCLAEETAGFDLAVIDAMLPRTEEALADIQDLRETVRKTTGILAESEFSEPEDDAKREKYLDAQLRRSQALKRMYELIDEHGGITLIERWVEQHEGRPWTLPTLFLTAVSLTGGLHDRLARCGVRYDWLVKPVSSEQILSKCAALLDNRSS